jgi:chloramphenicol 3-O phosphotransferase
VVLNGGSSSGKSSIARCLQEMMGPTWMTFGVDDLIRALPGGDKPVGAKGSITFGSDGSVEVDDHFRRAEAAWYEGLAAIARHGTGLVIDDVFLEGRSGQERLVAALSDVPVLWVGVRCDVAAERERTRPDRILGMAEKQADRVHKGVHYDLVVDTTKASAVDCAKVIAERLAEG